MLFGGAFDPPHPGHTGILKAALDYKKFDKVIVMPTGTPGHKARCKAPFHVRRYLCRLAFSPLGDVEISSLEGESLEVNYSYRTVEKLLEIYPGRRIWFLIGSDSALAIESWKNWQELARMVSFLIFSRGDADTERISRATREIRKFSPGTRFITRPVLPVSSTRIRREIERGALPSYLSPEISRVIREYGLYSSDFYGRNIGTAKLLIKLLLRQKRAIHTYNVEKLALQLAKIHGEDLEKTRLAALLHDIMKQQPDEVVLKRAQRSDIIDSINSKNMPVLHGFAAADYAKEEMGIEDRDILLALKSHTCGRRGMSRLEKIIYLADMLCEGRDFPEKERLLNLSRRDLDLGMRESLRRSIKWVKERGMPLDPDSVEALDYFEAICSGRNIG